MHHLLTFTLVLLLALIVYHDFRRLAIPLYVLTALTGFVVVRLFLKNTAADAMHFAGLNLLFSVAVISFAFLVFMLIRRQFSNPVNTVIGSGDLVFFFILCLCFSPLNFIAFFITSFAFVLLLRLVYPRYSKGMPLAGGQALLLSMVLLASEITRTNLFSDRLLLNLISGL
jgi:hypothetical protein